MRLPPLKKITREQMTDAPGWVDVILAPVNSFMEYVYQALNKNITYRENVACQIKEITYVTPSTYPTMSVVEFMSELKTKATDCRIMQIYEKDNYTPPTSAVSIPWVENDGFIQIYSIPGLTASKTYLLRVKIS